MKDFLSMFSQFDVFLMLAMLTVIFLLFLLSKKFTGLKKIFIIVSILYNVVYLLWRAFFTLPLSYGVISAILGITLLVAELMGFWQSLIFRMLFWKPFQKKEYPPETFAELPTVDVFISTYNEDLHILKKTIAGAKHLKYPGDKLNIYLCDDGHRDTAKILCSQMGIHYITRPDNKHAKAGNINNALSQTNGEFIMLLDADMVPKSNFLEKTIGYFTDEKMGFVQTPQSFYNPDPFQYNLRFEKDIPNEQDFFMMEIQAGRDMYNAVLHVGTNAVFRRKAIEEIGGIPTGTITEDMATGMLIQAKGYQSKFVQEVLCTGLSVENFADLVKQRERWARGNIQVTKKWNPLFIKGLSLPQRMIYADGFIYWFFGIQKMIYIICPLLYLIFGAVILNASASQMLLFWFPSFIASLLTFRTLVGKTRSLTWSHIYEVAMAPFIGLASFVELVFSKPIPFRVTPKGTLTTKTTFSYTIAGPHIVLFLLTVIGWGITIPRFLSNDPSVINSVVINIFWSVYNLFAIIMSIFVCLERPRKRADERLLISEPALLGAESIGPCRVVDISETGVQVSCDILHPDAQVRSENGETKIQIDSIGDLKGEIVWERDENGTKHYGIKFQELSDDVYENVVQYIADKNTGYHENK